MLILAVDYGSRRIGLAIGDPVSQIVSPLPVVAGLGGVVKDAKAVLASVRRYEFKSIIVGLPLNMNGGEGPQAAVSRRFGDAMQSLSSLPVYFADERLSTFTADNLLHDSVSDGRRLRASSDSIAASVILQTYFESGAGGSESYDFP